ncbi:hypothetical protein PPL_01398 [Heterostelium album PN500]|uniref:Uncharacterized protein n=1 Tax=Heterostelium pallidum (strain ATCC 26659 / Pp 5 / PN500) TaxID=670386 RepID=D3AZ58_HETP5|nr:hypothetical protein PPL_01398 [Heterostelium album PN500]EFA85441.1 hypothetical protein PPL_01398 [Heterostelium album PN500]|eukprot:XP_020437550.1 hypothetical protein PPL_01398 [Heterostelium album PN500]
MNVVMKFWWWPLSSPNNFENLQKLIKNNITCPPNLFNKDLFSWKGNVFRRAITLADVDNDSDNELIVGSLEGNLTIFKGTEKSPWKVANNLGSIVGIAVGDLLSCNKNLLVVISSEGVCNIYNVHSDDIGGKELIPTISQRLPPNASAILIGDIDHDGKNELIIGTYDHTLYSFSLVLSSNQQQQQQESEHQSNNNNYNNNNNNNEQQSNHDHNDNKTNNNNSEGNNNKEYTLFSCRQGCRLEDGGRRDDQWSADCALLGGVARRRRLLHRGVRLGRTDDGHRQRPQSSAIQVWRPCLCILQRQLHTVPRWTIYHLLRIRNVLWRDSPLLQSQHSVATDSQSAMAHQRTRGNGQDTE